MKKQLFANRHVRLWFLMALFFTLILSLIVSAIILIYRRAIDTGYRAELRIQLQRARSELSVSGYSPEVAEKFAARGIRLLLVDGSTREIIYEEDGGIPIGVLRETAPSRERRSDSRRSQDAMLLQELVTARLGSEDGSFFAADGAEGESPPKGLQSMDLFLCGREGKLLFCLFLPVASTNTAITLAIRYATLVSVTAWLIGLLLLYWLSKLVTRPHREIVETAAQIAKLDFSRRCPPALTMELDALGQSINSMADSLETNVKALQDANEQLQAELSARVRQQQISSELIGNLSHDLKTPIAIISGYAEGLLEGVAKTPEKQKTYYEMILRESEQLQVMVTRMLALSRMESGATPIQPETFDLTLLLDEVLDSFQRELEREGLTLTRAGYRPCMVHTDYDCARQSILNYVQNAIYHINNGKRIEVRLEDRGDCVRVRVRNSSAPIPEQEAGRLWDKLYRGDASRHRRKGEVGLGLAIVKGNMDRLGHSYGFENDPDFPGVCFWIELPQVKGPEKETGLNPST